MGRINLTALRVRRRALQNLETKQTKLRPNWLDVVSDIPPAQILTRQQPITQQLTQVRTRTVVNPKTSQPTTQPYIMTPTSKKSKSSKSSRIFSPMQIHYEEDSLRQRFFSDHPWELARPRVVLETSGDQYKSADWSTGIEQPGVPVTGESVVQRQLWLLAHVPDISVPEAYDIARKEFYVLRRQEETRRRIAAEEARAMGAQFGKSAIEWGMEIENKMYDNWEKWARQQLVEQDARNAAFSGTQMPVEEQALEQTRQVEQQGGVGNPRIGAAIGKDVFAAEAQRQANMRQRPSAVTR